MLVVHSESEFWRLHHDELTHYFLFDSSTACPTERNWHPLSFFSTKSHDNALNKTESAVLVGIGSPLSKRRNPG